MSGKSSKRHAKIITYTDVDKDSKHSDLKKKAGKLKGGDLTIKDLIGKQLNQYKNWDEKGISTDFSRAISLPATQAMPILERELTLKSEVVAPDDSHVYYNAVITNTSTTNDMKASFQEFRSDPIIDRPEDFHLSIVRFSIPGEYIPIFIASIQAGPSPYGSNSDPNKTNYSVTLSYYSDDGKTVSATDAQQYVQFVPQDAHSSTPTRWDATGVLLNNQYYSVYSYQAFLDMINIALSTAFANLLIAVGGPVGVVTAPFFIYDPNTQLIKLVAEKGYAPPASTTTGYVHIYTNALLSSFLETFQQQYYNFNSTNGKDVQYIVKNNGVNTYTLNFGPIAIGTTNTSTAITSSALFTAYMAGGIFTASGVPLNATATFNNTSSMTLSIAATATATVNATIANNNFYIMSQELPSLFLWNSMRSIVITTGTIPIKSEFTPNANQGSTADNFVPILTDFEPQQTGGNDRSLIQYVPTAEYRLIDLKGLTALTVIDLQIYWQDKQLNRYPIYLPPLGSADIKFLFRKKSGETK